MPACPRCRTDIVPGAAVCPHCGSPLVTLEQHPRPSRACIGWASAAVAIGVIGAIAVLFIFRQIWMLATSYLPYRSPSEGPASYRVTYRVTASPGVTRADLMYRDAKGDEVWRTVTPRWEISFVAERGQLVYVSARLELIEEGSITCEILVDGVVVKKETASGANVGVRCSAVVAR